MHDITRKGGKGKDKDKKSGNNTIITGDASKLIDDIRKKIPGTYVDFQESLKKEKLCISTGSLTLDGIIGLGDNSGFPRARFTEIFGWESSGKTTVAMLSAIKCIKGGGKVLYLDYEHSFNTTRLFQLAAAQGVSQKLMENNFFLFTASTFGEGKKIIDAFFTSGIIIDEIFVDSIPAMIPDRLLNDDFTVDIDNNEIGLHARNLQAFLVSLNKNILETDTAVILLNQMRLKFATGGFFQKPQEQSSGGNAIKFYTSLRIDLKKFEVVTDNGKEDGEKIGIKVRARIKKSKISAPERVGVFVILWDKGVDDSYSLVEIALAKGIATNPTQGYYNVGDEKLHGKEALRVYLNENEELKKKILTHIDTIVTEVSEETVFPDEMQADDDDDVDIVTVPTETGTKIKRVKRVKESVATTESETKEGE